MFVSKACSALLTFKLNENQQVNTKFISPWNNLPEVVYDTLRWYSQHVVTFFCYQEAQATLLDDQVHFAVFANGAYGMIDHLNLVRLQIIQISYVRVSLGFGLRNGCMHTFTPSGNV